MTAGFGFVAGMMTSNAIHALASDSGNLAFWVSFSMIYVSMTITRLMRVK